MQQLTLVYRGTISVEHNSNNIRQLSSKFQSGSIRFEHRGMMREFGSFGVAPNVYDLYVNSNDQDDVSRLPLDEALTGFLDRNSDILSEVIQNELRRSLPSNCNVVVQLSFWKGSVAFAATITLLLVGQHFAGKEALNFIQVAIGPPISRCLRHVIGKIADGGVSLAIALDPSSLAEIEQIKKRILRPLDRFDRKTERVARHVDREGKLILALSVTAIILAFVLGANYGASWLDAVKALFRR
jgi:hypothetical protein